MTSFRAVMDNLLTPEMKRKWVFVLLFVSLTQLAHPVYGSSIITHHPGSDESDLCKPCARDGLFSGRYDNGCCCRGIHARCTNVTHTIPKLPNVIQRLTCTNCFDGTLNRSALNNIISLKLTHIEITKSWRLKHVANDAFHKFKHLTELVELDFSDNKIERIPNLCFKTSAFPRLARLSFHKNMLGDVQKPPLDCFRNLTHLNLGKNRMKACDFRLFENMTKLVSLDLHSNWISNISNVDAAPRSLQYLNLSKNELSLFSPRLCGPDEAKVDSFSNLRHLNLAENLITIPWNASWKCMAKLRLLNLTSNPIRRILDNTFASLTSLEELLVADVFTSIDQVQEGAFNNTNLRKLNISNNNMDFKRKKTMRGIFKGLPSVTELDASGNVFKGLERCIADIECIADILAPMGLLTKLVLMKCRLQTLPANLLSTFHNITLLNMNWNEIENRPIDFSYNKSNLQHLYLAHNKIHTLDPSWLSGHVKKLRQIDLSYNPLDCTCDDKKLREDIGENSTGAYFDSVKVMHWPNGYVCDSPATRVGLLFKDFDPGTECAEPDWITYALIIASCCLFVFLVITGLIYRNIWYIRYWIYILWKRPRRRRHPRRTTRNGSETDPLIDIPDEIERDVFVINHETDDRFVLTDLQTVLESQMGYSSCIYARNCCNGAKLDLLVEGIYSCMYSVAVVSKSFLSDPWCLFQLDVAFDRRVAEKRSSLILVILEDIDFRSLNKYWCVMLTKTPTAHWCETRNDIRRKLFEEQLMKHLGDPVSQRHSRELSPP